MTSKTLPLEYLALAAIWGSSFLFMRVGGAEFGVVATAGMRVIVASVLLLPMLWFSGHWDSLRRNAARVLYIGTLNSALPFALFAYAVTSISTGLSGILNATVPLFGALIAWLWLKDRPGPSRVLGLVIGFTGIALLAKDSASFKPGGSGWAVLACLLAAICYGYAASFTKKYLGGVHPLATAAGSQLGAALALVGPTVWTWPAQMPGTTAWLAILVLGVVCSGLAYILYFRLLGQLGPSRAITVTFLVPVFAILYGTLLLGESLTPWMLGCGLVVVLGTSLAAGVLRLPGRKAA
ncbi:MAG: DMT family transporter [Rhodoferax sp.]|jgi:drug/metabolite transporter (DMT)-like permease|nr:DMT family transporter [Rhodoferax sp.]